MLFYVVYNFLNNGVSLNIRIVLFNIAFTLFYFIRFFCFFFYKCSINYVLISEQYASICFQIMSPNVLIYAYKPNRTTLNILNITS